MTTETQSENGMANQNAEAECTRIVCDWKGGKSETESRPSQFYWGGKVRACPECGMRVNLK